MWIFTCIIGFSLLLWIGILFFEGTYSNQFFLFFRRCEDLFADFLNVCGYSSQRDVYSNDINGAVQANYPPLSYMLGSIFSRIDEVKPSAYLDAITQRRFLIMFVIFALLGGVTFFWVITENIKGSPLMRYLCGVSICFSGCMLSTIERGNFILPTVFFCIVYLFYYDSNSKALRETALISLALAAAFKLSPAIFGIFLIYEKRYKDAIRVTIYGVILTLLPFLYFKGGFNNIPIMFYNMNNFFEAYSDFGGIGLKAVIYQEIKLFSRTFQWNEWLDIFVRIVSIGSSLFFLASAWLCNKKWEKVLAITLILLLVPRYSNGYCIIYLLPALVLFLNDEQREKADAICLFAFIVMCWVYVIGDFNENKNRLCFLILYVFMLFRTVPMVVAKAKKYLKRGNLRLSKTEDDSVF